MTAITFDDATVTYPGAPRPAVDALNLAIADGEFMVLVGPSGCGKSTALRMLAGLQPLTAGRIWIGTRDVTRMAPKERDVAMVFQNYVLYPHMTVADNIGFPLEMARMAKGETARRVAEAAAMLGLEDHLAQKPRQLSGGQQQRVALARAIVRQPKAFLMDEPLSNLDAHIRHQTRTDIAALQRRLGTTTLYVTHDQAEALTMGDRVAVLKDGELQQVATPRELYDRPADAFVARYIGSPAMNLIDVPLVDAGASLGHQVLELPRSTLAALAAENARTVTIGFRPESVELVDAGEGLAFDVIHCEESGYDAYAHGTLHSGRSVFAPSDALTTVRVDPRRPPFRGEVLNLAIRAGEVHVFSAETGLRVGTTNEL
jgi:multiple sugar transport system ATP-binding protein